MIEGNGMTILATFSDDTIMFVTLAPAVWSAACLAGIVGLVFSCFRSRRKQALVAAYVAIGLVALLMAWGLAELNGHGQMGGDWVTVLTIILAMVMPCALGMALILYNRPQDRPPKIVPPPRGTDE